MARQHGYIVNIPVFIPVDKNSLKNQIATGTAIHEATQTRDLSTITDLPGIRLHVAKTRDGGEKEIITRYTSVEIEDAPAGEAAAENDEHHAALDDAEAVEGWAGEGEHSVADAPATNEGEQDPATTTGRRRRAA